MTESARRRMKVHRYRAQEFREIREQRRRLKILFIATVLVLAISSGLLAIWREIPESERGPASKRSLSSPDLRTTH